MNIYCKLFGHRPTGINVKRLFATCNRCHLNLKVSYDMTYGETVVVGDYGKQKTFCWCECGNELCSSFGSYQPQKFDILQPDIEHYKCSKCGRESTWNFGTPAPVLITMGL